MYYLHCDKKRLEALYITRKNSTIISSSNPMRVCRYRFKFAVKKKNKGKNPNQNLNLGGDKTLDCNSLFVRYKACKKQRSNGGDVVDTKPCPLNCFRLELSHTVSYTHQNSTCNLEWVWFKKNEPHPFHWFSASRATVLLKSAYGFLLICFRPVEAGKQWNGCGVYSCVTR